MTRSDFDKGCLILGACGVPLGEMQMDVWFRLLGDLDSRKFEDACIELIKRTPRFYQQPNIPGLILEQDGINKDEKARMLGEARRAEEAKSLLPIPDDMRIGRDEVRSLIAGIGKLKTTRTEN